MEVLNKIDETLLKNIRAEMKHRDWNQSDLARKVGSDRNKISRLFKVGSWDSDLLAKLADAFNLYPWDLLREGPDSDYSVSIDEALETIAEKVGVKIVISPENSAKSALKKELDSTLSSLNNSQADDLLRHLRSESTADLVDRARDILGISDNLGKQKKNKV